MGSFFYEQSSFNAGIHNPLIQGNSKSPKRDSAVKDSLNVFPMVQGGVIRRGGTKFISAVKFSDKSCFFLRFKFGTTSAVQSYVIEMGDLYIRFYKDREQLMDGGAPVEIATPFAEADFFDDNGLFQFQFKQSADVLFIVHKDYKPMALKRTSDTNWSIDEMAYNEHPYMDENFSSTTFTASAAVTSGDVNIIASSVVGINKDAGFRASDVGRGLRILKDGQKWAWGNITAVNSTTSIQVDINDSSEGTSTTATRRWRLGLYNDDDGYPSVIAIHNARVVLAGQPAHPDRVVLSATGGFGATSFDFSPSNRLGEVNDDDAIQARVQDGELNLIEWISNISSGLLIGTTDGEWILQPSSSSKPLAPDNNRADLITNKGSASLPSVSNGSANVFVQASRSKVHEAAFSIENDGFRSPDLGLYFVNDLRARIKHMVWSQEPDNLFYYLMDDGKICSLTYMRDQDIVAWAKHEIAGDDVNVVSATSVPSPDNARDDLYLMVERTVDGETVKYVEYMTPYYEDGDERKDVIYADCAFVYDGVLTDTVTGLDHLEGQTVGVLVDGKSHPDQVVDAGQIELSNNVEGEKIIVGLKYDWLVDLLDPIVETKTGTVKGKTRLVSNLVLDFWATLDVNFGHTTSDVLDADVLGYGTQFDVLQELFTGQTEPQPVPEPTDNREPELRITGNGMFPACLLNATWEMDVE